MVYEPNDMIKGEKEELFEYLIYNNKFATHNSFILILCFIPINNKLLVEYGIRVVTMETAILFSITFEFH